MRIYLDVSCLNRPFDDQTQPRVRLEAEAVTLILKAIDQGRWKQVASEMAEIEISANSDEEMRRRVLALLPSRRDIIRLTGPMFRRAMDLGKLGFKPADALHVAAAEAARADTLLTCDDRMCRLGRRHRAAIRVALANPLQWLEEHENDSHT